MAAGCSVPANETLISGWDSLVEAWGGNGGAEVIGDGGAEIIGESSFWNSSTGSSFHVVWVLTELQSVCNFSRSCSSPQTTNHHRTTCLELPLAVLYFLLIVNESEGIFARDFRAYATAVVVVLF